MKKYICFFFLALIFAVTACGSYSGAFSDESVLTEETLTPEDEPGAVFVPENSVTVSILGAVESPGVFIMPEGTRVYEVINLAGGPSKDADLNSINLASVLTDGEQIIVPPAGSEGGSGTSGPPVKSDGRVNINTASKEELKTISGIGDKRAEDIISYREANGGFSSIEDIKKVSGIKDGTFEKIKDSIVVK